VNLQHRSSKRNAVLDEVRLFRNLVTLAATGGTPDGSVDRPAYSVADRETRERVESQMETLGMEVHRDAAGNSLGTHAGTTRRLKPAALGSHMDTVPNGARYDSRGRSERITYQLEESREIAESSSTHLIEEK
jgi:acetylornithine deacetylase/succinyl-diaminopimelate desuccinylase-like protein